MTNGPIIELIKVSSLTQTLLGLVIIGLGVGFLLDAMDLLKFGNWMSDWWPLLVIYIGLVSLMSNPRLRLWPAFIIGAGILLLLRELDVVDFNVWSVIWPSILIVVGLSFIFEHFGPKPKVSDHDSVDLFTAFSGIDTKNKSNNFSGGKLSAMFGGINLDLRDAKLKDNAEINVFTAFGGVELRVPKEWEVQTSGLPLFGGWEDKTEKPRNGKPPVLRVRGTCIFGGVEIKN